MCAANPAAQVEGAAGRQLVRVEGAVSEGVLLEKLGEAMLAEVSR